MVFLSRVWQQGKRLAIELECLTRTPQALVDIGPLVSIDCLRSHFFYRRREKRPRIRVGGMELQCPIELSHRHLELAGVVEPNTVFVNGPDLLLEKHTGLVAKLTGPGVSGLELYDLGKALESLAIGFATKLSEARFGELLDALLPPPSGLLTRVDP